MQAGSPSSDGVKRLDFQSRISRSPEGGKGGFRLDDWRHETNERKHDVKRPTIKQLRDYANAIGFADFDPQAFLDRYDATGWKYGSTKITNWMACVRTWKRTANKSKPRPPKIPYRLRENRINFLNRRKAQLLRLRQTPEVERELERIQTQLHKL
jgi:hypothetical protein